ncbi:hypothetical protein HOY80DRAFT_484882 [Tuber brumale]|nr:hypothetical protein HOY80DRAFT_484882 [Tuber brumale]
MRHGRRGSGNRSGNGGHVVWVVCHDLAFASILFRFPLSGNWHFLRLLFSSVSPLGPESHSCLGYLQDFNPKPTLRVSTAQCRVVVLSSSSPSTNSNYPCLCYINPPVFLYLFSSSRQHRTRTEHGNCMELFGLVSPGLFSRVALGNKVEKQRDKKKHWRF